MRMRLVRLGALSAFLALASAAWAQFGHPLKGSWSGDWGVNKVDRTRVLIDIQWDGKALTGTINPGSDAAPLKVATLDPETWAVHFEAERTADSGAVARYVIDGRLENLGAYRRVIRGTWTQGGRTGDFKLTRN